MCLLYVESSSPFLGLKGKGPFLFKNYGNCCGDGHGEFDLNSCHCGCCLGGDSNDFLYSGWLGSGGLGCCSHLCGSCGGLGQGRGGHFSCCGDAHSGSRH